MTDDIEPRHDDDRDPQASAPESPGEVEQEAADAHAPRDADASEQGEDSSQKDQAWHDAEAVADELAAAGAEDAPTEEPGEAGPEEAEEADAEEQAVEEHETVAEEQDEAVNEAGQETEETTAEEETVDDAEAAEEPIEADAQAGEEIDDAEAEAEDKIDEVDEAPIEAAAESEEETSDEAPVQAVADAGEQASEELAEEAKAEDEIDDEAPGEAVADADEQASEEVDEEAEAEDEIDDEAPGEAVADADEQASEEVVEEAEPADETGESLVEGEQQTPAPEPRQLKRILEALLFAEEDPISTTRLAEAVDGVSGTDVRAALLEMQTEYHEEGRGFVLEEIAGGYQLLSRPEFAPYLEKLQKKQTRAKLSNAALETLAIIAYRQPIGRADIEAIRGVQAGPILRMLMDRNMVKIVGREEVLGRPFLYGTTKKFLEHFGLKSLKDLPQAEELQMPDEE